MKTSKMYSYIQKYQSIVSVNKYCISHDKNKKDGNILKLWSKYILWIEMRVKGGRASCHTFFSSEIHSFTKVNFKHIL